MANPQVSHLKQETTNFLDVSLPLLLPARRACGVPPDLFAPIASWLLDLQGCLNLPAAAA